MPVTNVGTPLPVWLKTNILDDQGNIIGTAASPLRVDPVGTTVQPVSINGTATVTVVGSVGNPAAGPTGSPVPAQADYVGFNSGGNLVGVSATNPLPVSATVTPPTGTQTVTVAGTSTVEVAGIVGTSTVVIAGGTTPTIAIAGTSTVEVAGIIGTSTVVIAGGTTPTVAVAGTSTVEIAGIVGTSTVVVAAAASTGNVPIQIAVSSASSTQVLASNSSRKGCHIINMSNTTVSLAFGANSAVIYYGVVLGPGGTFWMDEFDFTTAAVNAISDGANCYVSVQEFQ